MKTKRNILKIKLIDLVGKNVKGRMANIVRQGGKYHYSNQDIPKYRILQRVYQKTIKGVSWLYWEWIPQADGLQYDCGYSGVTNSEVYKDSYLKIKRLEK